MISPCIKNCKLDSEQNMCLGCFRTINEIAKWTMYSSFDREKILLSLENRRCEEIKNGLKK
jgi:uncharacterized protein